MSTSSSCEPASSTGVAPVTTTVPPETLATTRGAPRISVVLPGPGTKPRHSMEAPTLGAAVASGSMGGAGTGCARRTMARAEPGLRLMWLATTTTSGPFCVGNRSSTDDGAVPSGNQRELVMAVLGESSTAACSSVELPTRTATTAVGRRGLPPRISASLCANSDPGTSSWPRAPHDTGSITAARAIPNQRVSVDFVDRLVLSMRAREQCARQGLLGAGHGSSRTSPRPISQGMSRSNATPVGNDRRRLAGVAPPSTAIHPARAVPPVVRRRGGEAPRATPRRRRPARSGSRAGRGLSRDRETTRSLGKVVAASSASTPRAPRLQSNEIFSRSSRRAAAMATAASSPSPRAPSRACRRLRFMERRCWPRARIASSPATPNGLAFTSRSRRGKKLA